MGILMGELSIGVFYVKDVSFQTHHEANNYVNTVNQRMQNGAVYIRTIYQKSDGRGDCETAFDSVVNITIGFCFLGIVAAVFCCCCCIVIKAATPKEPRSTEEEEAKDNLHSDIEMNPIFSTHNIGNADSSLYTAVATSDVVSESTIPVASPILPTIVLSSVPAPTRSPPRTQPKA
jgi:hypothetical protein